MEAQRNDLRTIIALYRNQEDAEQAIDTLAKQGVPRDEISLISREKDAELRDQVEAAKIEQDTQSGSPSEGAQHAGTKSAEGGAVGAGVGAVAGGVGGLLAGLGTFLIPGIGPIVAAGPLAGFLAGAGIGAATGGLIGALVGLGVPKEQAEQYAEGIRRGNTLVMIRARKDRIDELGSILAAQNPIDMQKRSAQWTRERRDSAETEHQPPTEPAKPESTESSSVQSRTRPPEEKTETRAPHASDFSAEYRTRSRNVRADSENEALIPEQNGSFEAGDEASAQQHDYEPERETVPANWPSIFVDTTVSPPDTQGLTERPASVEQLRRQESSPREGSASARPRRGGVYAYPAQEKTSQVTERPTPEGATPGAFAQSSQAHAASAETTSPSRHATKAGSAAQTEQKEVAPEHARNPSNRPT